MVACRRRIELIEQPAATEVLVEHYRAISGARPDWAEYRQAIGEAGRSFSDCGSTAGVRSAAAGSLLAFSKATVPVSVATLKNGDVQAVELCSRDGNVVSSNFVARTDNEHLEGADCILPVIRMSVATARVACVLEKIDAKLTTTAPSKLNMGDIGRRLGARTVSIRKGRRFESVDYGPGP